MLTNPETTDARATDGLNFRSGLSKTRESAVPLPGGNVTYLTLTSWRDADAAATRHRV
jgi:hypothetical protein